MLSALINLVETLLGLVFTPIAIIALGILFKNLKSGEMPIDMNGLFRHAKKTCNNMELNQFDNWINYAKSKIGDSSTSSSLSSTSSECSESEYSDTSDGSGSHAHDNKTRLIRHLKQELRSEQDKKTKLKTLVTKLDHKLREKSDALARLSDKLNEQIKGRDSIDSICTDRIDSQEKIKRLIVLLKSEIDSKECIENFICGLTQVIAYDPSSYDCTSRSADLCDIDYSSYLSCISDYADEHADLQERVERLQKRLKHCDCSTGDCSIADSVCADTNPDSHSIPMNANLLLKCQKLKSYTKWKKQIQVLIADYHQAMQETDHTACSLDTSSDNTCDTSSTQCACLQSNKSSNCKASRVKFYEKVDKSMKTMMKEMMKDMIDQKMREKGLIKDCDSDDSDNSIDEDEDLFSLIAQLARIICECKESVRQHREDLELIVDSTKNDIKLYNTQIAKINKRCDTTYPKEEFPDQPECIDINYTYDLVNTTSSAMCALLEYLSDCHTKLEFKQDIDCELAKFKHAYKECNRERDAEKEASRLYAGKLKECQIEKECLLKDNCRLESDLRVSDLQLSSKEEYTKGLVNFLQTYLKFDSSICKTENAELISIIKSDNNYNNDILRTCLDNYDEIACKDVKLADHNYKMFKQSEKLVKALLSKYNVKCHEIADACEELYSIDIYNVDTELIEPHATDGCKTNIIRLIEESSKIKVDMEDRIKNLIRAHECDDSCQVKDGDTGTGKPNVLGECNDSRHDGYDSKECYGCYCKRIDESCTNDIIDTSITGCETPDNTADSTSMNITSCSITETVETAEASDTNMSTPDHNKSSITKSTIQNIENASDSMSMHVNSSESTDTDESRCKCRVHKKYCLLLAKLRDCQGKNARLLIKIKNLKLELDELKAFKCLIPTNTKDLENIETCFKYKPEYELYFECYGYPENISDIACIDPEKMNMIREELARSEQSSTTQSSTTQSSTPQSNASTESNESMDCLDSHHNEPKHHECHSESDTDSESSMSEDSECESSESRPRRHKHRVRLGHRVHHGHHH